MELRRYWAYHPKYPDLPDNIQGKYSFRERPQHGIIIKTSGATRVDLQAENFVGTVVSYAYLTKVNGSDGLALEWIREDGRAIASNGGRFPSPPGVYYLDLVEDNQFYVDPLLDIRNEQVTMVSGTEAQLQNRHLKGTLRLYESPSNWKMHEGVNYTVTDSGAITLTEPLKQGRSLIADYRFPAESVGPFPIRENYANTTAIPGVVLAFGRRNKKGDKLAVVVQETRQPSALEYGGRWEISLDIDVMSRDVYSQQEIADQSVIYLWGIARNRLSTEGLEIMDVTLGGETEEVYDETGDDYFYNCSISMTVQTEWSVHVPLQATVRSASPLTQEHARFISALGEDDLADQHGDIKMLESLGLEAVRDPFFVGKTKTFEVIK